uniref:Shell matrix protein n=1 Tax=Solanum tuberosum TaxID=4113 RepID=M1D856_SOLTU
MIIFKKSRRNSNDSIYCRACRNPVAHVQDYIWRVRRAGIFSRVYNVLVSNDENYRLGSTIAKTYCSRCGTLLRREFCFWNGVPLLHLNEEQDLGANDQNAHQDLGANEQNGDQDLGANEENADQDGGATEENADQDGDATDQDGDATDQDGDTTDQDGDAIEQNADQDRDTNEQNVGVNKENSDPDGGGNEQNDDQDDGTPMN